MEIISGIGWQCKDSLGGIRKVWLTKFIPYSRKRIVTDGDFLVQFPPTILYEFESLQNPVFSETWNEANEYYEQTISLVFPKMNGKKLRYLKCLEFRIVVQDRNGIYHIFGLETGLTVSSANYTTGSAKTDLNGLKIDFTAKDENGSMMFTDLGSVGFIDNGTEETFYLLYEKGVPFILENNNNLIL